MKILIPVDMTEWSCYALEFVARQFSNPIYRAEVIVLNIAEAIPGSEQAMLGADKVKELLREDAQDEFAMAHSVLDNTGIRITELSRDGDVAQVIADVVEELGIDLIVKGTHSRSALAGMLFGSSTNELISMTQCPMLLVRGKEFWVDQQAPRIGIVINSSVASEAAARIVANAKNLLPKYATYYLIHVTPDNVKYTEQDDPIWPTLKILEQAGIKAQTFHLPVKTTAAAGKIAEFVNENKLDFLIIGPRGRTPLSSLLRGSLTVEVISKTSIPMLIAH